MTMIGCTGAVNGFTSRARARLSLFIGGTTRYTMVFLSHRRAKREKMIDYSVNTFVYSYTIITLTLSLTLFVFHRLVFLVTWTAARPPALATRLGPTRLAVQNNTCPDLPVAGAGLHVLDSVWGRLHTCAIDTRSTCGARLARRCCSRGRGAGARTSDWPRQSMVSCV